MLSSYNATRGMFQYKYAGLPIYVFPLYHYKGQTVSRPSYFYNENPYTWEDGFCVETKPRYRMIIIDMVCWTPVTNGRHRPDCSNSLTLYIVYLLQLLENIIPLEVFAMHFDIVICTEYHILHVLLLENLLIRSTKHVHLNWML